METPNATLRQDLIQNAVSHQAERLEESAHTPSRLETLFNSELNHDLLTWPRECLEAYIDSYCSGRIPLSAEQLQDVLEAAFARDEDLAMEFLQQLNAGKSPQTLPGDALQVAVERSADYERRYVLLVKPTQRNDLKRLSAQLSERELRKPIDGSKKEESFKEKTNRLAMLSDSLYGSPGDLDAAGARELLRAVGIDPEEIDARLQQKFKTLAREYAATGWPVPELLPLALQQPGPQLRLDPPLTDSGVYRGTIIATRGDDVIQQITSQSAVIHHKDLLNTVPFVGQHVRIRYSDGVARVEAVRERSRGRELSR
jgi:hypothetical protein